MMEINSCSHEYYANGNPISFNPSRLRFVDSLEEQIPRDELGSSKRSSSNTHNCDTKNPQEVLLISQNRTVLIRVDLPISFFSPPISMSKQNFCDFHFGFGGLLFGIYESSAALAPPFARNTKTFYSEYHSSALISRLSTTFSLKQVTF